MYIKSIELENIRSVETFKMNFANPAGWHVLIGDNGSGKSTIVRSIAAVLIGPEQIHSIFPVWKEWLNYKSEKGSILLEIQYDKDIDRSSQTRPPKGSIKNKFIFMRKGDKIEFSSNAADRSMKPTNYNWSSNKGWFSVAYGPFRRFTGGDNKWNKIFYSSPKAGSHLSVFGEDIALAESIDWLKELDRKRLKEKENNSFEGISESEVTYNNNESEKIFKYIKEFINNSGLLPHDAKFDKVDVDGDIVFLDGYGNPTKVIQMSDGYRSILSMTFELIRQMVLTYGADDVFKNIKQNKMKIDLPGVVLIDEIDAHLHPTWQTRIGQWFTKYFCKIQFIVTTHSPLVCRACEKGSIWRLAAPDSEFKSGEVKGIEKNRLVFGNILDAYGTEIFGANVSISENSNEKLERLAELNIKSITGEINKTEKEERIKLQSIFPTEVKK